MEKKAAPKRRRPRRKNSLRSISAFCFIIGFILIGGAALLKYGKFLDPGETKVLSSATLIETLDISELSTAEFTYNGIAKEYKDEKKNSEKFSIRYDAVVKAGINMQDVQPYVDEETKTVKLSLPEIRITATIVGEKGLKFLPENAAVDLKTAMSLCEADAVEEATASGELYRIAEENLKSTIEGLLYPVVHPQGFELIWE